MPRSLVVKLTSGDDAPERCAQAFTVSAVAAASGVPVSLWLTGEASWLAVPGRAEAFVCRTAHPCTSCATPC
jgi:predicted peroxiredoxin